MLCPWRSGNGAGKLALALAEFYLCAARKPGLTLEDKWIFNLYYNIVLSSCDALHFNSFPLRWTDTSFIFRMRSNEHIQLQQSQHRKKYIIHHYSFSKYTQEITEEYYLLQNTSFLCITLLQFLNTIHTAICSSIATNYVMAPDSTNQSHVVNYSLLQ